MLAVEIQVVPGERGKKKPKKMAGKEKRNDTTDRS